MKFKSVASIFTVGCLVMSIYGCGGGGTAPPLGQVSGVVTLDGEPLEHAQLIFQPENGRPSVGETDSSGYYELSYTGTTTGALIGPHKVLITSAIEAYSDESGEGQDRAARKELLPPKYHSQTTLTANVEQGSNEINFDLKTE